MTPTIPLVEPQRARAGETWQWRREDLAGDYPATSWTLRYALKNATDHLEIVATADGIVFAVTVPLASTKTLPAGKYRMVGYVEDAGVTQRFGVYDEEIDVDPSYANTGVVDDRSHARKVLEAIEAVIENRATKDQEEYQIGHRMLKRTPLNELHKFRQQYEGLVRAEDNAERAARGQGGSKIVYRL
jgi:hypothetical protein